MATHQKIGSLRGPRGERGFLQPDEQAALDQALESVPQVAEDAQRAKGYAESLVTAFMAGTEYITDLAVKEYASNAEAETYKELNASFVGAGTQTFILSKFADLTTTSITDALNTAIAEVPEWSTIVVPPKEYVTSGIVENNGKSVRIDATGCRFIQGANTGLAFFTGEWESTQSIAFLSTVTVTADSGNSGPMTRIVLATAPDWKVGDVVKVFSNNIIAEGRTPSSGAAGRHGEFATVYSVDGNTVHLSGALIDKHDQNPRVAKMKHKIAKWVGGSYYGSDESFANNWTSPVIQFRGLYRPRVDDFTIERSSHIGVLARSNYRPRIHELTVDFLSNRTSPVYQLGYGVLDASNYGLTFTNSQINNVRHAYTDDTSSIQEDANNIESYGRSYFARVRNVDGVGCTSGVFSPHHYGYGHTFTNCGAQKSIGAGFGIRGSYHQIIDCIVDGCSTGVNSFNETGGTTKGTRVVNLLSRNVTTHVISQTDKLDQEEVALELVGGTFEGGTTFLSAFGCDVRVSGAPRWVAPATLPNGSTAARIINGSITVNGSIEFDYSMNTAGTDLRMLRFGGSSLCELRADQIIVKNQGAEARMATLISGDGTAAGTDTTYCPEIVVDVPTSIAASFNVGRTVFNWHTADYNQNNMYTEQLNNAINAGPLQGITRSLHQVSYYKAIATSNVGRTMGTPAAGRFPGQVAVVSWENPHGGAVLTIPNTALIKTGTGADITLGHEQSKMLIWDGTTWRVVG